MRLMMLFPLVARVGHPISASPGVWGDRAVCVSAWGLGLGLGLALKPRVVLAAGLMYGAVGLLCVDVLPCGFFGVGECFGQPRVGVVMSGVRSLGFDEAAAKVLVSGAVQSRP
jgi:hypothetical protein